MRRPAVADAARSMSGRLGPINLEWAFAGGHAATRPGWTFSLAAPRLHALSPRTAWEAAAYATPQQRPKNHT